MMGRVMAGSAIVVVAIVVALVLPRPQVTCSYGAGGNPCAQPYGLIPLRVGIVVVGLIIAVFLVWDGHSSRRRHR